MNFETAIYKASVELKKNNIKSYLLDSEILMSKAVNKDREFVKLNDKTLPFKDKEFDFVVASHVIEHVEDVEYFIKELQRISSKGYIELPTILEDNLVFENKKEHLWHMEFDDVHNQLIISKKIQYLEPMLTVSSAKSFSKYFRQSLIIELFWEKTIEFNIIEKSDKL